MKNRILMIILAAILMLTSSLALADTVTTVTGSGETQVSADTAIVSLGVNASFSASDTDAAKAESLKKAVADALARAEALAEAAGLKLTGIETISEGGVFSFDNNVSNFTARGLGKEEAVDTGTIVQAAKLIVSASVTVTFRAE